MLIGDILTLTTNMPSYGLIDKLKVNFKNQPSIKQTLIIKVEYILFCMD